MKKFKGKYAADGGSLAVSIADLSIIHYLNDIGDGGGMPVEVVLDRDFNSIGYDFIGSLEVKAEHEVHILSYDCPDFNMEDVKKIHAFSVGRYAVYSSTNNTGAIVFAYWDDWNCVPE